MSSYNDTEIGDKVVIIGTVVDVNECGVQTIEAGTDKEGFVIAWKITDKIKEAIEDEYGIGCNLGDSSDL
jgi:hypothetical protein